jgi:hypothetical protein
MQQDGVEVRVMTSYNGIYHPKAFWISAPNLHLIWVGSNNLTRNGMLNNIELGALLEGKTVPKRFIQWATEIDLSSQPLTDSLYKTYEGERQVYAKSRASTGTFTWSGRERKPLKRKKRKRARKSRKRKLPKTAPYQVHAGDLIIEVMPRETGQDGKQIQFPVEAATRFFGILPRPGANRTIYISPTWINDPRSLTMTVFKNHTVRLAIRELDYSDRPCLLVFRRARPGRFEFDIVSRATFPTLYRDLLSRCLPPTRRGSRHWGFV